MTVSIEVVCARVDDYLTSHLPSFMLHHVNPSVSLVQMDRFIGNIQLGSKLAIEGVREGAARSEVKRALKRSLLCFIAASFLLLVSLFFILLPFSLLAWLCNSITPFSNENQVWVAEMLSPITWLCWTSNTLTPSLLMFFYTSVLLYDDCFRTMLDSSEHGRQLNRQLWRVAPSYWDTFKKYIQRLMPMIGIWCLLSFLRSLPWIHSFVPSIWLLKLSVKVGAMDASKSVASRASIWAGLIFIAYSAHLSSFCYKVFHLYVGTVGLSRELLDPYLSRLDGDAKTYNSKQQSKSKKEDGESSGKPVIDVESSDVQREGLHSRHTNQASASRSASTAALAAVVEKEEAEVAEKIAIEFPHTSAKAFCQEHHAMLLGLGLVFIFPCSFSSLVALLFAPLAHAAAGNVLEYIITEKAREEAMMAPTPTNNNSSNRSSSCNSKLPEQQCGEIESAMKSVAELVAASPDIIEEAPHSINAPVVATADAAVAPVATSPVSDVAPPAVVPSVPAQRSTPVPARSSSTAPPDFIATEPDEDDEFVHVDAQI